MTFIKAHQVAKLIAFPNAGAFLRHRARLEADTGFPIPLPTCTRPLKWRRDAVENWIKAQGLSRAEMLTYEDIVAAGPNVVLMREAVIA